MEKVDLQKIATELQQQRAPHVLLTGYSGAGKTTLANRMGKDLGLPVVHLDDHISDPSHGEPNTAFYRKSRQAFQQFVQAPKPSIIEGVQIPDPYYLRGIGRQHVKMTLMTPLHQSLRQRVARNADDSAPKKEIQADAERQVFQDRKVIPAFSRRRGVQQVPFGAWDNPEVRQRIIQVLKQKGVVKQAKLLPDVNLREHQGDFVNAFQNTDGILAYHGLGTGKTLSSIAAAETAEDPAEVMVPAALRPNFRKAIAQFTDDPKRFNIDSYDRAARNPPHGQASVHCRRGSATPQPG
jgi:hypothetical protein